MRKHFPEFAPIGIHAVQNRLCSLLSHAEGEEDEPAILANSVLVELEDEMENDDDDIEDDEEELDIDVCLAAAVEDRPMVGIRRSARSANVEKRRSLRVAQLLQEQTEEEAVYIM